MGRNGTEDRSESNVVGSKECNRVEWRSTLRYAATAKRRWERDIVRLLTLSKMVGTAFGTARLIRFALSADDALLFRSVGPIHHRGNGKFLFHINNLFAFLGNRGKFPCDCVALGRGWGDKFGEGGDLGAGQADART